MSAKKILRDLEQMKIKALKILSNNPKDLEAKELLGIVEMSIEVFEEESVKEKDILEAYGSIAIEVEDYRFVKDERNNMGVEVYRVDSDGLYEYLQTIKLCKEQFKYIKDIENLKIFAIDWYKDNIKNQ